MDSLGVGHRGHPSKRRLTANGCHDLRGLVVLLQNKAVGAFVAKKRNIDHLEIGN